jgi:hypothetical protein
LTARQLDKKYINLIEEKLLYLENKDKKSNGVSNLDSNEVIEIIITKNELI